MSDEALTSKPLLQRLVEALRVAMKHFRHDDECGSSYIASDGSHGCGCGKTQDRFLIDALFSDEEWRAIRDGRVAEPPEDRLQEAERLLFLAQQRLGCYCQYCDKCAALDREIAAYRASPTKGDGNG